MISLEEIARMSGVSRRSVTRALKDKNSVKASTWAKVEAVLKETDYTPNMAARYLAARCKNFRILFVSVAGVNSPFHMFLTEKARVKAKELQSFGITVDFYIYNNDTQEATMDFEALMQDFSYSFMIMLPIFDKGPSDIYRQLMEKAREQQVPAVFYNIDDPAYEQQRLCYVGCDYFKSGRIAAGLVAMCTQGQGNVGVISNKLTDIMSYKDRMQGFKFELNERYPGLKIAYEHIMQQSHGEDVDLRSLHEANLQALYLVNPGDYSVVSRIKNCPEFAGLKIITNDLIPQCEQMLRDNKIAAVVTQGSDMQADLPLDLACEYLINRKRPERSRYFTSMSVLIGQCL